jgi:spermidine synthase
MHEPTQNQWYIEYFTPVEGHMHGIKEILASAATPFQKMEFVVTCRYGKALFLDGKIQSSQADEFIYHEALVHPPMLLHPKPEKVFIVGGGEGATLRDILKHPSVRQATMVDIDGDLVRECRKWLPEYSQGAFEDPRTRLIHDDARKVLTQSRETYDVIIVDLTEPLEGGPAYLLYTREFYKIVSDHLSPEGTMSLQAGTTRAGDTILLSSIAKTLATSFPVVRSYQAIVPSFDLPWGFCLASKKNDPLALTPQDVDRRMKERNLDNARYYDGITHQGIFSLPKHLRKALAEEGVIIRDDKPMFLEA